MKTLREKLNFSTRTMALMLVAAVAALSPEILLAQDTTVFDNIDDGLETAFDRTRTITYVVGGLGAIGLGVGAFFGRFKWGWFFSLVGGLAVVAMIIEGIDFFITSADEGGSSGF